MPRNNIRNNRNSYGGGGMDKRRHRNQNWNSNRHPHVMGRGPHSQARGAEPQGLLGNLPHPVMQQGGGATGLLGEPPISHFREGSRRHPIEEDYNRPGMPVRGGRPSGLSPWESGMIPSNVTSAPHHLNRMVHHMPSQPMMRMGYQERNDFSLLGPSGMGGGSLQVPNVAEGLLGGRPDIPPLIGGRMMNMNNRGSDPHGPPPNKSRRIDNRIGGNIRDSGSRSRNQSSTSGGGVDLRQRLKFRRSHNSSNTYSSSSSYTKKSNDSSKERSHKKPEDSSSSSRDKKDNSSIHRKLIKRCEDVELPIEAIHCHVCNLNKFSSKKAYLAHLRGKTHEEMFKAFQARNHAVLNLLRSESKMLSKRHVIAARINGETPKMSQCFKCHCVVVGSLQKHMASIEHKVVNNFQIMKCCDSWFRSRNDIEEHKLSLEHLLKTYESRKKSEEKKEETEENEGVEIKSEVKEEKKTEFEETKDQITECEETKEHKFDPTEKVLFDIDFVEEAQFASDVKPYSAEIGTGKTFLKCVTLIDCSACDEKIPSKDVEVHCKSYDHYSKVLDVLKKKEEGNVKEEIDATEELDAGEEFNAEDLDKSGSKQEGFDDTEGGDEEDKKTEDKQDEEEEDMGDDDYTLNDKAVLDYEFMEDEYEHEDSYEVNAFSNREEDQVEKDNQEDDQMKKDQEDDQMEKDQEVGHKEEEENLTVDQAEKDQGDRAEDQAVDKEKENQTVDNEKDQAVEKEKEDQTVDNVEEEDQAVEKEKEDQTVDKNKEDQGDDKMEEEDQADDKMEENDQAVENVEDEDQEVDHEFEMQEAQAEEEPEVNQSVENLEEEVSEDAKKEETEETKSLIEEVGVTRRSRRCTSNVGVKRPLEEEETPVKNTSKRGRGRGRGRGRK